MDRDQRFPRTWKEAHCKRAFELRTSSMPHEAANGNGGTLGKPCPLNTEARRDTEALLHEAEYLTTSVPKRSVCDFALTSAAGSYMMTPYASLPHYLVALNFLYSVWVCTGEMSRLVRRRDGNRKLRDSKLGLDGAQSAPPTTAEGSRVLREGEHMRMMTPLVRGDAPVFVRCRRIGDAQHEGVLGGIS
jgi:hypothetical protein